MQPTRYAIRYTIYDIRYTSYANRRNTPNPAATQNKPPILPKLSTNYDLIMQNKPNFPESQIDVNKVLTKDYENIANSKLRENKPNTNPIKANTNPIKANTNPIKANTKPIKANKMPKQSQYKAKQTQSNPTCRGVASGEAGSKAKKCNCQGNPHASHRAGTVTNIKIVTVSLTLPGIDANLLALQFKGAKLWNYPG